MTGTNLPTEDEIREVLRELSEDYDKTSEELVLAIYDLEKDYSTMERRRGITEDIKQTVEEHVNTDEI